MKFKLETDRQTTMLTCNMPDCKDADTLSKSDSSKNAATKRSKNSSFLGIGLGTLAMAGCSVMRVLWGIYIIGHSWGFSFTHTSPPTHCIMDYRHTQSTLDSSLNQQCRMGSRLMVATTTRKIFNIVGLFLYFTIYSKSDFFWKTSLYWWLFWVLRVLK